MTKPHESLKYHTPDAVAECWNGVIAVPGLYGALWDCVDQYDKFDIEDCGPSDVVGLNSVAQFWDRFSTDHQTALNRLAASFEGEVSCW